MKVEKREDRYKKIFEKKKATTPEELCSGYPQELAEYVKYTRGLEFEQNPDYNYLRGLFRKIMEGKYEYDLIFDWIKDRPNPSKSNNKDARGSTPGQTKKQQETYELPPPKRNKNDEEDDIDEKDNKMNAVLDTQNCENDANIMAIPHNEHLDTQMANFNAPVHVNPEQQQKQDNQQNNNAPQQNAPETGGKKDDEGNKKHKKNSAGHDKNKKEKCLIF